MMVTMWYRTHTKLDQLHTRLYKPYQALQVLGNRLAGQPGEHDRPETAIRPEERGDRWSQVMSLLLPVLVFYTVLALELILAGYILLFYGGERPWLIIPLAILMAIPLSPYVYRVMFDSWRIYGLLKNVPKTDRAGSKQ
jgi:hypothetical protein